MKRINMKHNLAAYEAQLNEQHRAAWSRAPWPLPTHMPVLNMPGLAVDIRLLSDARARRLVGRNLATIVAEGGMTLDEVVEHIGYKFKRRLATECLNIIKAKAIDRGIL